MKMNPPEVMLIFSRCPCPIFLWDLYKPAKSDQPTFHIEKLWPQSAKTFQRFAESWWGYYCSTKGWLSCGESWLEKNEFAKIWSEIKSGGGSGSTVNAQTCWCAFSASLLISNIFDNIFGAFLAICNRVVDLIQGRNAASIAYLL